MFNKLKTETKIEELNKFKLISVVKLKIKPASSIIKNQQR